MGFGKKDKFSESSSYSQYSDVFPFKSYDEILAARKRATNCKRGMAVIAALALIVLAVAFGLRGRLSSQNDPGQQGETDDPSGDESSFILPVTEAKGESDALILTYDVSAVVESASKSVVGIMAESYSNFSTGNTGSGIIISEDGYIVTNNHVISDGDNITVVLFDGSNFPAYLIGYDELTDIAVLKVETKDLTPASFGDSSEIKAGEPAIAIGNPGGLDLQGTVTAGIISATDRKITVDNNVMSLVQTDASINPGNSGGPLLDKYGRVIGVTSAKITADGYEGLGFAIPINTVRPIVEQLISDGYVSGRPLVGVSVRTVSQLAAAFYGLPRGLLVDAVAPSSSVAEAGLAPGDIITHFNGSAVKSISDVCAIRNQYKSGDTVSLSFYRSGATYDIEFELDEQKDNGSDYDF